MKLIRQATLILILLGFSSNLMGKNSQYHNEFYDKIAGTYQDKKTSEIVFIHRITGGNAIFYQANPYGSPKLVKCLKVEKLDRKQLTLKAKFKNSNYVCLFTFRSDLKSFVCKNPDGSKQIFTQAKYTWSKPFSYFVSLFPKHSVSKFNASVSLGGQTQIPIEAALKYISANNISIDGEKVNENDRNIFKDRLPIQSQRLALYFDTPQSPRAGYAGKEAFYYVKQLSISPKFYTLLLNAKGYAYGGESFADIVYLANFTKTGELIDYIVLSGKFNRMYEETSIRGVVNKSKIQVKAVKKNLYDINPAKDPERIINLKSFDYSVLPSGKIQLISANHSEIEGVYRSTDKRHYFYVIRHPKLGLSLTSQDSKLDGNYEIVSKHNKNHLSLKHKDNGQVLQVWFNAAKTRFVLVKPNKTKISFNRNVKY